MKQFATGVFVVFLFALFDLTMATHRMLEANKEIGRLKAELALRPATCPAPLPARTPEELERDLAIETTRICTEWYFSGNLTEARQRMCGKGLK